MRQKILNISTSHKTRGGITSVINAYKRTNLWDKWNFTWIETHIDEGNFQKIKYFLSSLIEFFINISTASIVHIHVSEPMSASRKIPFFITAKALNKPIIIHFHSFSIESTINGKFEFIYKYIFTKSDTIIVLSKQWKDWLIEKWPSIENKIEIVYNPCSNNVSTMEVSPNSEKTVLFAGTLNSRKGYSDLLHAFSMIDNKDWTLVLAGNGELESARSLACTLEISDRVKILGWVSGPQKHIAFKQASIFCLPSYAEGFPMAVLDALSYSIPIITTPVGGITDIMRDGYNCLLFEAGDIDALRNHLNTLIDNNHLRDTLSKRSKELADSTFHIDHIVDKLENIYQNISKRS